MSKSYDNTKNAEENSNYLIENAVEGETEVKVLNEGDL